ncbi:lytic transglycosylase domain-containing protein [Phenylobacterium aquaticum]|uniref:lytic transglycosylase domain-containing protein n=1 Tax=Phenylobacterium aquaticum TaxID=1763816 RepID=UPI001F5D4FD6|nr:lytic transglycosylase domain-containing protein [Phenylobacterium aquaticum]MCI3133362.1 lytic transglycosylase domain-containing protein [Phenylobacterium aquaticum]
MALSLAAALTLAAQCAPTVAPETLLSVVQVESRFEPLAIGVNGLPRVALTPASVDEAVARAGELIAAGRSIDLGLAQINSKNLQWLGLSLRQVFEPCANLSAAARVLQDGYGRSDPGAVGEQVALRTTLSYYNTGHPSRGVRNGYVGKVEAASARIVPAISGQPALPSSQVTTPAPPESPRLAWDVFGDVQRDHRSFVTTVSALSSGGFK